MTTVPSCILDDRAVLKIEGADAESLLQGLVTNDLDRLQQNGLAFGALLSPQGKIQFDFFIHRRKDYFLFDMDKERAADFLKRLSLYRLRSNVLFDDISADNHVMVHWGADVSEPLDPRMAELGSRTIVTEVPNTLSSDEAYHQHRIALGVPEAGKDFAFDDIFPHDAMMDLLNGVHFDKGCYVGQEVVSRVQHRSSARKRFLIVETAHPFPAQGTPIYQDEKVIGHLGKAFGTQALALLRIDKIDTDGKGLSIDGRPIIVRKPTYLSLPDKENS